MGLIYHNYGEGDCRNFLLLVRAVRTNRVGRVDDDDVEFVTRLGQKFGCILVHLSRSVLKMRVALTRCRRVRKIMINRSQGGDGDRRRTLP